MNIQSTDGKRWTKNELNGLLIEDQFRLRGLDVTRLDTLIDAAFAFVLTLLVISFDRLPTSFADMQDAIKRIPAFAASFGMLMWFWIPHRRWSRRYGLENSVTIPLSLALMLVVMVYVYPLRATFESLFGYISGGYLPSNFRIETADDLRGVLAFYSAGFLAMSLIFNQLYRATLRSATDLALDQVEIRRTRVNLQVWAVVSGFALLSILLAFVLPDAWIAAAGYLYFALGPAMSIPGILDRRNATRT